MFPIFGLLNRMIFWELAKVFLMSLVGLTGLFLIAGLIQQATQMGLSPAQVLEVIPLLIPSTLPYTIPATTLFASCVVYGRVSNDNEAVAMKAAGVDLLNVLRPAVAIGLATTAVTAGLYYAVIPRTQQTLQAQLLQDPEEVMYNLLRRERRLNSPTFPYALFVRDVQGRRLIDVVIKQKAGVVNVPGLGPRIEYNFVARAREARLSVDLERGKLALDPDRWVLANGIGDFAGEIKDSQRMEIDLPDAFTGKNIKARPMALEWHELGGRAAELGVARGALVAKKAENERNRAAATDADARRKMDLHNDQLTEQIKDATRQIRNVEYEYHFRPALAVGCFCFAVIGCPVGIWANRADYLSTFVTCFLPAMFVYYPLLLAGGGLAKDGKVPMAVGVWGADAVAGLAAGLLTWRLIKR